MIKLGKEDEIGEITLDLQFGGMMQGTMKRITV